MIPALDDTQPSERRQSLRVKVALPARIEIISPEPWQSDPGTALEVLDLSECGALICGVTANPNSRQRLMRARLCRLFFTAAPDLPAELVARIMWTRPEGSGPDAQVKLGLHFEECPESHVQMLRARIAKEAASLPDL